MLDNNPWFGFQHETTILYASQTQYTILMPCPCSPAYLIF